MTAGDIVVVDTEGRRLEGERQPSSETDVHLVVYRRRLDVGAIIHTEPVYSNVFGVLGQHAALCLGQPHVLSYASASPMFSAMPNST